MGSLIIRIFPFPSLTLLNDNEFHALRATFATRCIEQGIEPRTLQELLGHADFGLTMNLYGYVVDNTKTKAMNKIKIAL